MSKVLNIILSLVAFNTEKFSLFYFSNCSGCTICMRPAFALITFYL